MMPGRSSARTHPPPTACFHLAHCLLHGFAVPYDIQVPTTAFMRSICRLWVHDNWKYGQMRSGPRSECKRYVFGVATGTCLVEVPAGHIQTSGRCSVIRAVSKESSREFVGNTWTGTSAPPPAVGTQQQRWRGPVCHMSCAVTVEMMPFFL